MPRKRALLVVITVLAVALSVAVPAATATTEPAVTFLVSVRVTDSGLVFTCRACKGGELKFRRGWAAHFDVVNSGSRPYTVDIGGLRTRALRPGQKQRLSAYFDNRGSYAYTVVGSTLPRQKGALRVV